MHRCDNTDTANVLFALFKFQMITPKSVDFGACGCAPIQGGMYEIVLEKL